MKVKIVFYSMYGHIYRMAEAVAAGANNLVVGSYLFRHPGGVKRAVADLRKAVGD